MKKTVLIIDDSLPIRYLLEVMLNRTYNVVSACDGLAAMAWLKGGNMPDLVITDLQMPNINGWELIDFMTTSNLYQHIPLMVLSGVHDSAAQFPNTQKNIKTIMKKPFDPVKLLDTIDLVLKAQHVTALS
ncbi:response regulator [Chitinophaga tropicalis]|uniref:response regulator n=1 Tax=Chitinophaga tropicalis TaxID=2683588 RepID=UPI0012F773F7|nr:response regulator [Chitinophaga tropicalis]